MVSKPFYCFQSWHDPTLFHDTIWDWKHYLELELQFKYLGPRARSEFWQQVCMRDRTFLLLFATRHKDKKKIVGNSTPSPILVRKPEPCHMTVLCLVPLVLWQSLFSLGCWPRSPTHCTSFMREQNLQLMVHFNNHFHSQNRICSLRDEVLT